MPWRVDEANPVCGVGQEFLTAVSRFEDPSASLVTEVDLDAAAVGDQTNQPLGHVRVQLVDDEDPAGVRVGIDLRFDMSDEVGFGPRRANPRFSNAPLGHIPSNILRRSTSRPLLESRSAGSYFTPLAGSLSCSLRP